VETTSGQSRGRQAHLLQFAGWKDAICRRISHVCSNVQGNEGKFLTEQHGTGTGKYFESRKNKRNAEIETENLKMSPPSRNRRGHLQLADFYNQWQRITSLCHSGIYIWKMRNRVAKDAPLKSLEQR
jgi:hypothetical protein